MAFGVSQKVSHDISSAFGKGLHGLKMEAMATPKKGLGKRMSGRAVAESVMLGVFTITVAAIPVIVTHVPAPESLITVVDLLQDWCTPSICFVVLIVGVMIATFGVWGSDSGSLTTPEQNHKTFTEAYLTQGPVSATQIDPLRMPDIFFSAEAARANALSHSATFPVRVAALPTSVLVPVYYPALIPPQSKEMDTNERFLPRHEGRFESNGGERFVDERFVDDRFVPRGDGRFSPRMEERFSPERFVGSKGEERFGPRLEDRFPPERFVNSPGDEMYAPQVQEMYPEAEKRYVPQVQEMYPEAEERYVPQVQEMYPEVEERYESQVQGMYPEVEERYESQEQDRFEPEEDMYEPEEESTRYVESDRYGAPHEDSATGHDDDEARSESECEGRYEPVEDSRAYSDEVEFERQDDRECVESEADEVEPLVESRSDVEDAIKHYPHESYEDDEQSLPEVVSPPRAPDSPPAPQFPPSQRSSSSSNATATLDVSPAASLPSRRKPPTVPTPAPLPETVTANSPQKPTMSVRVEPKETPDTTTRPSVLSPRTPPRHASGRRPLSSSSSRSYAEFVRRSSSFSPRTPLEPPRPLATPKPPSEPVASSVVGKSTSTNSPAATSSPLTKQMSMPARRPREVMVVDDDKLENEAMQGSGEDDDVDQRVEAFLKNFREQMRLQRQESLQRHRRTPL